MAAPAVCAAAGEDVLWLLDLCSFPHRSRLLCKEHSTDGRREQPRSQPNSQQKQSRVATCQHHSENSTVMLMNLWP